MEMYNELSGKSLVNSNVVEMLDTVIGPMIGMDMQIVNRKTGNRLPPRQASIDIASNIGPALPAKSRTTCTSSSRGYAFR
jgi:hypothetical protein